MRRFPSFPIFLLLFALLLALAIPGPAWAKKKSDQPTIDDQPDPVWPPPPDEARIKWVRFIRDEYDIGAVKKSRFIDALAGKKRAVFALDRPIDVTADSEGNVYVLDFMAGIVKFDMVNKEVVNLSETSNFKPQNPVGIAVDSHFLYVSDSKGNTVAVLDHEGRLLRQITDPSLVDWPVGLAVDEKAGLLFLVNGHGHNVLVFEADSGRHLRTIGKRGEKNGQFNYPTYITLLPDERIAVMDSGNFRCQILNYNGKFLGAFGELGDKPGELFRPKGLTSDSDGNLYIVDGAFQNIQVFDQQGRLLTVIGGSGTAKGQFYLPIGIDCVGDNLYVADQFNQRIQVLRYIPEGKGGGGSSKS